MASTKKLITLGTANSRFAINYSSEKNRYIIAAIFVAILMVLTYWLAPPRWGRNDDLAIMYIVSGVISGTPSPMTVHTNMLIGYMMSGLYTLVSVIPWWGLMHVLFIFISHTMILKSFIKIAAHKQIALFAPFCLYLTLYVFFLFFNTTVLFFTTTPAMMGAAACVLAAALFQGESRKARILDSVVIVLLVLFSYMIRRHSGLGILPFFCVVIIMNVAMTFSKNSQSRKLQIRSNVIISICVAITLLFAYGFDLLKSESNGMREFREYNYERAQFTDFPSVSYDEAPELFASIGWDSDLYYMVRHWQFLDERITTENFGYINEYQASRLELIHITERVVNAARNVWDFISDNIIAESAFYVLMLVFLVYAAVIIWRIFRDKINRGKHLFHLLFIFAIMGIFIVSVLYLGWHGRLRLRAFFVPMMPAACLLFYSILLTCGSRIVHGVKKFTYIAMIIIFSLGIYFYFGPYREVHETANWHAERRNDVAVAEWNAVLRQFYLDNPDNIYLSNIGIIDAVEVGVLNVLPSVFNVPEKPFNLNTFGHGGWLAFSPAWYERVRANSLEELFYGHLLKPNVYLLDISTEGLFYQYMYTRYNAVPEVVDFILDYIYIVRFNSDEK